MVSVVSTCIVSPLLLKIKYKSTGAIFSNLVSLSEDFLKVSKLSIS